jgi:hypothetical protein
VVEKGKLRSYPVTFKDEGASSEEAMQSEGALSAGAVGAGLARASVVPIPVTLVVAHRCHFKGELDLSFWLGYEPDAGQPRRPHRPQFGSVVSTAADEARLGTLQPVISAIFVSTCA